jgi:AmiR/NasT family two-component response regulator
MSTDDRDQVGAWGMVLPAVFADDEPLVRALLTARAREAGHRVADDAPMRMQIMKDCLGVEHDRVLADIQVTRANS